MALVCLAAILGLSLLNGAVPATRAEQAAPGGAGESPRQESSANWTVGAITFESEYPDGFTFRLEVESDAGEIASARVEWTHRPNTRPDLPITVRRAEGEIDPETGAIVATWRPSGATSIPPWVGVDYRWRLRDSAGNEFVTEITFAEYEDTSRDWERYESDEVLVFATGLPDNVGDLVLEAMDAQRQKYVDGWGQLLPYRPRVILFGDFDTWLEWQTGHQDTSGLGVIAVGFTSDVWGGTAQVLFGSPTELAYGTVLHEIEHLYQQEFLAGRNVFTPGWFIEGDATFYQLEDMGYALDYVDVLVDAGQLPVLLQGSGPTTGGESALHGYYIGYSFFLWLDQQWGIDVHREIMALLADNVPFSDALEQATGMTVEQLEREWRTWLGATADAPTLVPTWTPVFPTIATPMPQGG